jgi:hypothetical protein
MVSKPVWIPLEYTPGNVIKRSGDIVIKACLAYNVNVLDGSATEVLLCQMEAMTGSS